MKSHGMTFEQFYRSRRACPNPRGDFIRELRRCEIGGDISTWDELEKKLQEVGGFGGVPPKVLAAGRIFWEEYEREAKGIHKKPEEWHMSAKGNPTISWLGYRVVLRHSDQGWRATHMNPRLFDGWHNVRVVG